MKLLGCSCIVRYSASGRVRCFFCKSGPWKLGLLAKPIDLQHKHTTSKTYQDYKRHWKFLSVFCTYSWYICKTFHSHFEILLWKKR